MNKFEELIMGVKMERVSSDILRFKYRQSLSKPSSISSLWVNAAVRAELLWIKDVRKDK